MHDDRNRQVPLGITVTLDELDEDPYAVYARLRPGEPLSWLPATGMYHALAHDPLQRLLLDDVNVVVGWRTSTVYDTFGVHMMSCEGAAARRLKRPHRQAFLQPAIDAARTRPADGSLLAALVHDPRDDALSDEEISPNALIVMFGGISTVEAPILNTLWILAHQPGWLETVQADRSKLPAILEESIRLIGPVKSATRMVTRDIKVDGVSLREGDVINLILSAANHDPAVFEAPGKFRPGRANIARHLGFAAGPHLCLGIHLARAEARIARETLFDVLPGLVVDLPRSTAPRGAVFRQPARLTLRWHCPVSATRAGECRPASY